VKRRGRAGPLFVSRRLAALDRATYRDSCHDRGCFEAAGSVTRMSTHVGDSARAQPVSALWGRALYRPAGADSLIEP
jgi:hypothetical protein